MNTQEFIDSALQILRSGNSAPEPHPITAAKVGYVLRRAFGGPRWQDYGFGSLKLFLEELERMGLLRIGQTDRQALAIQMGDSGQFDLLPPTSVSGTTSSSVRPLRKQFWVAFALEQPKGRRFVSSKTGEVRIGLDEVPSPPEGWIEIEPIDAEKQKTWALDFLKEKNLEEDVALTNALKADEWYREFPKTLITYPGNLVTHWNRERSKQVSAEVQYWVKKNGLAIDVAFQQPFRKDKTREIISSRSPAFRHIQNDEWVRDIVLKAVKSAPTEWLLELSIPIKYVLRALNDKSKAN